MHRGRPEEAEPTRADDAVPVEHSGVALEDEADDVDADADEAEDVVDSLLLDEDSDAPNLVREEHPQRLLAGRIEILEKIGEGGMGTVWRGTHLRLQRTVAVKILDETLQLRADGRERFLREARALALLEHRNVVRIHDCDELPDGKLYLCMELLTGETLREIIKRGERLDPLEVIDAGRQVCDAVQAAHELGILHRDLTPSNIIRLHDDARTIKVIDWGLCKYLDLFYVRSMQKYADPPGSRLVTPFGCRFGTPEYMAPELIARDKPGSPSFCTDVYALAVVLYEALTGRHPFMSGDRKLPRPIRDLIPGFDYHDLESALRAALRFRPEDRTQTMAEMREALELARECLLAQREAAVGDSAAIVVAPQSSDSPRPHLCVVEGRAAAAVTAEGGEQVPAHAARRAPRVGRIALAAVLGLVCGVGVTIGAQRLGGGTQPVQVGLVAVERLDAEVARANIAEVRAARCEADPTAPPPTTAPPAQTSATAPGEPSRSPPGVDRQPVLAALDRTERVRRTRSASPQPTLSFPDAMRRLTPRIRSCAQEAGMPEGPITVQIRRKGGVLDAVKVLKFSKEHSFAVCVDRVVRSAGLPAGDSPIEEFTFSK